MATCEENNDHDTCYSVSLLAFSSRAFAISASGALAFEINPLELRVSSTANELLLRHACNRRASAITTLISRNIPKF